MLSCLSYHIRKVAVACCVAFLVASSGFVSIAEESDGCSCPWIPADGDTPGYFYCDFEGEEMALGASSDSGTGESGASSEFWEEWDVWWDGDPCSGYGCDDGPPGPDEQYEWDDDDWDDYWGGSSSAGDMSALEDFSRPPMIPYSVSRPTAWPTPSDALEDGIEYAAARASARYDTATSMEEQQQSMTDQVKDMVGDIPPPQIDPSIAVQSTDPYPQTAEPPEGDQPKDDPINKGTGEYRETWTDLFVPGVGLNFRLTRTYASQWPYNGPLGHNWTHSYNRRIVDVPTEQDTVILYTGRAVVLRFAKIADNPARYESIPITPLKLKKTVSGWSLESPDGVTSLFDELGQLVAIRDLNDNEITLTWEQTCGPSNCVDDANCPNDAVCREVNGINSCVASCDGAWDCPAGYTCTATEQGQCLSSTLGCGLDGVTSRVTSVVDTVGRTFSFNYDYAGRLADVSLPTNGGTISVLYEVDSFGDLIRVASAAGYVEEYEYDSRFAGEELYLPTSTVRDFCRARSTPEPHQYIIDQVVEECATDAEEMYQDCLDHIDCHKYWNYGVVGLSDCINSCSYAVDFLQWYETSHWFQDHCTEFCDWLQCADLECTVVEGGFGECGDETGENCDVSDNTLDGEGPITTCDAPFAEWVEYAAGGSCDSGIYYDCVLERDCSSYPTEESCDDWCFFSMAEEACLAYQPIVCEKYRPFGFDECEGVIPALMAAAEEQSQSDCMAANDDPREAPVYGSLPNLTHNLVRITDGMGQVYLENTYGEDVEDPNFDRVIAQRFGEVNFNFAYYDLINPPLSQQTDGYAQWVTATAWSIDVCPCEALTGDGTTPRWNNGDIFLFDDRVGVRSDENEFMFFRDAASDGSRASETDPALLVWEVRVDEGGGPGSLPRETTTPPSSPSETATSISLPGEPIDEYGWRELRIAPDQDSDSLPYGRTMTIDPPAGLPARSVRVDTPFGAFALIETRDEGVALLTNAPSGVLRFIDDAGVLNLVRSYSNVWFSIPGEYRGMDDWIEYPSPNGCEAGTAYGEPHLYELGEGRLHWATVVSDDSGVVWTYYSDKAGRTLRMRNDSTGAEWHKSYDRSGRLRGYQSMFGTRACWEYDADWNPNWMTVLPSPDYPQPQERLVFRTTFDDYTRPESVFQPNSDVVSQSFEHDGNGNLVKSTLHVSNYKLLETSFDHDAQGRVIYVNNPTGEVVAILNNPNDGLPHVVSHSSPNGETISTEIYRNELGQVTKIEGNAQPPVWLLRDLDGRVLQRSTTLNGQPTYLQTFEYDDAGYLCSVSDSELVITYTYNARGLLSRVVETPLASGPDGEPFAERIYQYEYNARHELSERFDPSGNRVCSVYDDTGRVAEIWMGPGNGNSDVWHDDCLDDPAYSSNWGERVAKFTRGPSGNLLQKAEGLLALSNEYDGYGRVIETRLGAGDGQVGDGTAVRVGYDARGQIVWRATYSDTSGLTPATGSSELPDPDEPALLSLTELSYDGIGRLTTSRAWWFVDGPTGRQWLGNDGVITETIEYQDHTNSIYVFDDSGEDIGFRYDAFGRHIATTHPDYAVTFEYFDAGRKVVRKAPGPQPNSTLTTVYRFTDFGALERATHYGDQGVFIWSDVTFDSQGRPIASYTPEASFEYSYTPFGEIESVTRVVDNDPDLFEKAEYFYDVNGRIAEMRDGLGHSTTWDYDALGRLTYEAYSPDGNDKRAWTYYVGSDAVILATDRNGQTTGLTYDAFGQVHHATSGSVQLEYVRSALGLEQVTSIGGVPGTDDDVTLTYHWDSLGQPVVETSSLFPDEPVGFTYNNLGELTHLRAAGTGTRYEYDALGRVEGVTFRPSGTSGYASVADYQYGGLPFINSIEYGNGLAQYFHYDDRGRRTDSLIVAAGEVTDKQALYWQKNGLLGRVDDTTAAGEPQSSVFGRDGLGRLTVENHGLDLPPMTSGEMSAYDLAPWLKPWETDDPHWQAISYDAAGNWNNIRRSDQEENTVPVVGTQDNRYTDFDGPVLSDAEGNTTAVSTGYEYFYDPFGRMTGADTPYGQILFSYDGFGRLARWQRLTGRLPAPETVALNDHAVPLQSGGLFQLSPGDRAAFYDVYGALQAEKGTKDEIAIGSIGDAGLTVSREGRDITCYFMIGGIVETLRWEVAPKSSTAVDGAISGEAMGLLVKEGNGMALKLFAYLGQGEPDDLPPKYLGEVLLDKSPKPLRMSLAVDEAYWTVAILYEDATIELTVMPHGQVEQAKTLASIQVKDFTGGKKLKDKHPIDIALHPGGALVLTTLEGGVLFHYSVDGFDAPRPVDLVGKVVATTGFSDPYLAGGFFTGAKGEHLLPFSKAPTDLQYAADRIVRQRTDAIDTVSVLGVGTNPVAILHKGKLSYLHAGWAHRVSAVSDASGEIEERYAYDAFLEPAITGPEGRRRYLSHVGNQQLVGGQPYLPNLKMHRFGQRWYVPRMGRWLTPDPAGYVDGPNRFSYVNNQPVAFWDPSGLGKEKPTIMESLSFWENVFTDPRIDDQAAKDVEGSITAIGKELREMGRSTKRKENRRLKLLKEVRQIRLRWHDNIAAQWAERYVFLPGESEVEAAWSAPEKSPPLLVKNSPPG